jgi:hypothetical protein
VGIDKHTSLLQFGVGCGANPSLEPNEASFKKMPDFANKYWNRVKVMDIDKHTSLVHSYLDLRTYLSVAIIRTFLKVALNFDRKYQTKGKVMDSDKHTSLLICIKDNGSNPSLVSN